MSKFSRLLARASGVRPSAEVRSGQPARSADPADNPLELDEDLFAGTAESVVERSANHALIAELESRLVRERRETELLREENRRQSERLAEMEAERIERAAEVALLEQARAGFEQAVEDLRSALEREQAERALAVGALESARQDFAGLLRELMDLQRARHAAVEAAGLRPATAA